MRILYVACCLLASAVHAETYSGRVVAIADGDTLTVLDDSRRKHKIRLAGIDAPEKRQPFGERSKQHLSDLVFGKDIEADCVKVDRNKREVCKVIISGVDANLAQIRAGMAWWYRAYAKEQSKSDQHLYSAAEKEARDNQRGMWREAGAIAPWDWRRDQNRR